VPSAAEKEPIPPQLFPSDDEDMDDGEGNSETRLKLEAKPELEMKQERKFDVKQQLKPEAKMGSGPEKGKGTKRVQFISPKAKTAPLDGSGGKKAEAKDLYTALYMMTRTGNLEIYEKYEKVMKSTKAGRAFLEEAPPEHWARTKIGSPASVTTRTISPSRSTTG
jgi:hypothetical protein